MTALKQALQGFMNHSPETLVEIFDEVAEALSKAKFPEVIEEGITDDGETYQVARCPHCKNVIDDGGVTVVDWGTRESGSDQVDAEAEHPFYSISYGDPIHADTLYVKHTECGKPISLTGWREDA